MQETSNKNGKNGLLHSNILNVKHFSRLFYENMHKVQQNKTFEWNCTLYFFIIPLTWHSLPLLDMVMMAHACSSQGGFFRTQLFCIALTVVPICTIYFSSGWMWLEFHWPLEHGTCPLAAGGQTAQLLRWPRSTAVLYIFHPKVPNLTSIPPCAPHRAQLTAPPDLPEV